MAEPKTKPARLSVEAYLGRIADPVKQADCRALVILMRKLTGQPPVLWGPSIVGFGRYHYTYESGHSGEMCATGFAARKTDISIYLLGATPGRAALLRRLGKHKMGQASCRSSDWRTSTLPSSPSSSPRPTPRSSTGIPLPITSKGLAFIRIH